VRQIQKTGDVKYELLNRRELTWQFIKIYSTIWILKYVLLNIRVGGGGPVTYTQKRR